MNKLMIFLSLSIFLVHSLHAGFSVGMTGAVLKQAKKLDEKVRKHRLNEGWVLVPGNPAYGTRDFYVMKYEAKNINRVATSQPEELPWVYVTLQTAIAACAALGGGAHLITINEAQTINRNVEAQPSNWADGVIGSSISVSGGLKRGNIAQNDSTSYGVYDWRGLRKLDAGNGRNTKAKLVLSNGNELWDWSGNVWEWLYGDGPEGQLGTPSGVTYDSGAGCDWACGSLNEERPILGPSNSSWTNSDNGIGSYNWYGTPSSDVVRGGWGVFTLSAGTGWVGKEVTGFRCAKP